MDPHGSNLCCSRVKCNELRGGRTGVEWVPNRNDWCPQKRDAHGENAVWTWRQGWVMLLHIEEHERLPVDHQKRGESSVTDSPSQPWEGANPADTFISHASTVRWYISVVWATWREVLCYGSPGKHTPPLNRMLHLEITFRLNIFSKNMTQVMLRTSYHVTERQAVSLKLMWSMITGLRSRLPSCIFPFAIRK